MAAQQAAKLGLANDMVARAVFARQYRRRRMLRTHFRKERADGVNPSAVVDALRFFLADQNLVDLLARADAGDDRRDRAIADQRLREIGHASGRRFGNISIAALSLADRR